MIKDNQREFYKSLGNKIKKARRNKDIKASDLAQQLSMSVSNLTSIERGETKIGLDKIPLLSEILNEPIENFFNDIVNNINISHSPTSGNYQSNITVSEIISNELINQLKVKDEQIAMLLQIIK
ncbi:MAG: helix-turn-helix transcriptional regulator [Chitinophagaceae bacterium]